MARSYDLLIQKILEFLRLNLTESIDLAKLAEQVNCSKSWLIKIFIKHTGKGPIAHLSELRIQKAKELLRNTNMSISEIAIASGFGGLAYFGIAFRKATKLSASEFRESAREPLPVRDNTRKDESSSRPWFSDPMSLDALAGRWRPVNGEWVQESGSVCGTGEEDYSLELTRLLPDNFRLSFEIKLESAWRVPVTTLRILLCDRPSESAFYSAILHDVYGVECVLRRKNVLVAESAHDQIKEGVWHKITVAMNDDAYSLSIDGEERISFRDPFPAPYEKRCRFRIVGHRSRFHFRNVQIDDLGFLSFARSIRQADALYNSGLLQQARHFYERMLETETNPADTTELCSKISLCLMGQNDLAAAREWALKVPSLPATDFWAQQAALALLEIDWRENRIEDMRARILSLSKRLSIRCRLKGVVQQAAADFDCRGFFEEGLLLRTSLHDIEKPNSTQALGSMALVCESLLQLNRLESALAHLNELAHRGRTFRHVNEYWLFTLADACNIAGRKVESRSVVQEIRARAHDEVMLARCDVYEAYCLQAEGAFDEAVALLCSIGAKHPKARHMTAFAQLSASFILTSLGRPHEALAIIAEIERSAEGAWYLAKGYGSRFKFPPLLAKGQYREAAEILLADSRIEDSNLALHVEQAIEAALIFALSGDKEECGRILGEVERRFPDTRVRYYASLAAALKQAIEHSASPGWATGVTAILTNLPYPVRERIEILYLAGLLFHASGEQAAGHNLLARIGREDHSNQWPAVLARKLTSSSTSDRPR